MKGRPMRFALLCGNVGNCGDHLIVERAKSLFARFLPDAETVSIDRTRPYSDSAIASMESADAVVLAGGPFVRNNTAEILNLDGLALSGRLASMPPFVAVGAGSKTKPFEPFSRNPLKPTPATRILFGKLESSPWFNGTRDYETVSLMRNLGFFNFRFSGCPALHAPDDPGPSVSPVVPRDPAAVVFSCGASNMMPPAAALQNLSVARMLRRKWPRARVVAAFHNPVTRTAAAKGVHEDWWTLPERMREAGLEPVDISGDVGKMLSLYRSADLHVGYRVHAHVLMTSWRRPSILVAEDVRGSGMADVIDGRTFRAWKTEPRPKIPFLSRLAPARWTPPALYSRRRVYDPDLAEALSAHLDASAGLAPNVVKADPAAMERWFAQFRRGGDCSDGFVV